MLRQIWPLDFAALGPPLFPIGEASGGGARRYHSKACVDRHFESRLSKRRGRAANDEQLAALNLQISEQASPGRRVSLRDRGQLGPREIRFDRGDIGYGSASVFGV